MKHMWLAVIPLVFPIVACSGEDCAPRETTYCQEGITYWVDSCGEFEEIHQRCLIGCNSDHTGCLPGDCNADTMCDDGNLCTDDVCRDFFCTHLDNRVACDDGDACTRDDRCTGGNCRGQPRSCDDANPCTDDTCDPATGCVYSSNTAGCDDASVCTTGDHCQDGACVGTPLDCDDRDGCTTDSCDARDGCRHTYACAPEASCVDRACVCHPGYRGTGFSCTDIDECAEGFDDCDPRADCTNLAGSYDCTCRPPYAGDGFSCTLCGNGSCDPDEDLSTCPADCDLDITVLVADALAGPLDRALAVYLDDLRTAGHQAEVIPVSPGTAADLRGLLGDHVADYDIEGALLVGDLPAAWYEQTAFETYEEFPCDIYLMDLDATWTDGDGDGMLDGHTALSADIFVSRLTGSAGKIEDYFDKLHDRRTSGPVLPQAAFIFMDDDWEPWAGNYGLDAVYASVDLLSGAAATDRPAYLARMEGAGAEFVYQWIHAYPQALYIMHNGGYQIVYLSDIDAGNHRGTFLNLFNCSGARFTEPGGCLSQGYLLRTDYGLADIGSTKTGGIHTPDVFHARLASGATWGEAFRAWYNDTGKWDDDWYLGIVIAGDPLLRLPGATRTRLGEMPASRLGPADIEEMARRMARFARNVELGTFADYRARHPAFFRR